VIPPPSCSRLALGEQNPNQTLIKNNLEIRSSRSRKKSRS